eukprot:TRINITY_DN699_c0_g3_i1.p1 TRINITY_DN699_c0_g3~~TRINITY_DN699_c0_g3_i1.p1  ORF type:complete len:204 (-),score=86.18 TRINITY_DN699_c0_g3_i1:38-649(-)
MAVSNDKKFKIILLGNVEVGKSSIILRFVDGQFLEEINEEIEVKQGIVSVDGVPIQLIITDTAGQERFRTLTSSYFRNADAVVLVFDVTEQESFNDLESHLSECGRYAPKAEKFLVGNKIDLEDRKITFAAAQDAASKGKVLYFETSAKDNTGIRQLFEGIARKLVSKQIESRSPAVQVLDVNVPEDKKKKSGCKQPHNKPEN